MLELSQTASAISALQGGVPISFFELAGIVAGVCAFADISLYILAIFGRDYLWRRIKRTVPNRATWFIWSGVGVILTASYSAAGATDTIWFPAAYALGFIVIALLSLKHGEGGFALVDILCFFGAAASVWAWWVFNSPQIALFATVAMDGFGATPTVEKSWVKPWTENRLAWTLSFFGSVANLLAIDWGRVDFAADYAVYIYPVFMLIETGLITAFLYRRRSYNIQTTRHF